MLAEVEAVVRPECVLATNTSSLSITRLAAGLAHPERVVGFHFFNPVAVLPLVEVVRAAGTDDATLATAFAVGTELRKSCVLVRDAPAFVVNRLLTRFLGEVTAAVDEGTPIGVADRALEPLGLPMSPFTLLALVGPAVALHVAETLHAAYPDRFAVSGNLGPAGRGRQAGGARLGRRRAGGRPAGAGAVRRRRPAVHRGAGAGAGARRAGVGDPGAAGRGRRGRGRRTSTCACCSARAGRSTWAASRRTWTAPGCPSG